MTPELGALVKVMSAAASGNSWGYDLHLQQVIKFGFLIAHLKDRKRTLTRVTMRGLHLASCSGLEAASGCRLFLGTPMETIR